MKYTPTHEWIAIEGGIATIGITDYAQKELGAIVYAELPTIGVTVKAGDEVCVLESTKAAVDIYTPLSGVITAINLTLQTAPETINKTAESDGWIFKLRITRAVELEDLMDVADYNAYISGN